MPKLKAGDKVRITDKAKNQFGWASDMEEMINDNKVYTIRDVKMYGNEYYTLKEDGGNYTWSAESFTLVSDDTIVTMFKVGSMEFDTRESAADHVLRKRLDAYIKRCGGEEFFVNYIIKNKAELVKLLTEEI